LVADEDDPVLYFLSKPHDVYWTRDERNLFFDLVKDESRDWESIHIAMKKSKTAINIKAEFYKNHHKDEQFLKMLEMKMKPIIWSEKTTLNKL
jgi:hypothetical protein